VSAENVEVVRQALEAFRRRDNDAVIQLYDPEVEFHSQLLDDTVYRGVDDIQAFFRDQFGAIERQWEAEEWFEKGDQVVVAMRTWGQGKKSGVPFESRYPIVCTVRHDKLWRLWEYPTTADALKAVGLEE
jgi:ketosteroid isomerase-like protein